MKNLLLTLPNKIKELNATTMSAQDKWEHLGIHNELLGGTVELKHLVACDEDGKPIQKPEFFSKWVRGVLNKHIQSKDLLSYGKTCKEYRKAYKSVIFEGWEVVKNSSDGVTVTKKEVELTFTGKNLIITINIGGEYWTDLECINTFEDLAIKTDSNPLELRS